MSLLYNMFCVFVLLVDLVKGQSYPTTTDLEKSDCSELIKSGKFIRVTDCIN